MTRGKAAIEIVKMWMCVLFIMNFRFERWHFYYSAADFDALYHAFFYGWKTFRKTFTEHLKHTTDFRADLSICSPEKRRQRKKAQNLIQRWKGKLLKWMHSATGVMIVCGIPRLNSIFWFDPPYLIAIPKVLMLCYLEVIRALICFTPMLKTYLGTLYENWNYGLELKSRRCLFNCICDILTKQCNLLLDRLEPLIWKRGKRDFWCEGRWRITALSKVFLWAGLFMCGKAAARTMLAGVLTKPFYSVDFFCKLYDPLEALKKTAYFKQHPSSKARSLSSLS